MKTLQVLAAEAIDVQDACNLSGVVHGWSRAITEVREALRAEGVTDTDAVNRHPINVLWAEKCRTLAFGREDFCDLSNKAFTEAYMVCKALAGRE